MYLGDVSLQLHGGCQNFILQSEWLTGKVNRFGDLITFGEQKISKLLEVKNRTNRSILTPSLAPKYLCKSSP
jgi:hypothetical protein